MQCEYCEKVLSTLSSLKHHQKTVKYCLAKQNKEPIKEHICSFCKTCFAVKSSLNSHLRICKSNTLEIQEQLNLLDEKSLELSETKQKFIEKDRIISEKDRIISEKDRIIEEQKILIKELHDEQKIQNKNLQHMLQSLAEKAISKSSNTSTVNQNTTNQVINNMMPITDAHLQDHVQNLNPLHVQNGASGYAKYALEFPLKDMIVCTDFQRRSCKYKDENGNVISDPEMTKITKRLFSAIKDRNEELINEYSAELQAKWKTLNASGPSDMNEEEMVDFSTKTNEALEFVMNVLSQKRQVNEMADGMRPELFYGFVRELAAGCYRADK
jgi:hypothetical protein